MKIVLIAPSSGRWNRVGRARVFNGRVFRFSLLSLLSVAAETPEEHQLHIADEQVDDIPFDSSFDLVGITCMTALAPRAYELSLAFRRLGVPVVLGGMHPTLCPDEARQHADAVVVGPAEGVWRTLLADLARGKLQPLYDGRAASAPRRHRPRRTWLDPRKYAPVHAIQATRGCPHQCELCSISAASGGQQTRRPIADVVDEIRQFPGRRLIFVDDNLVADRAYAGELFDRLAPLGKTWVTQCTLRVAEDASLLARMARAGCVGVFVGLESFSDESLAGVGKDCHRVAHYREAVRLFHRSGIGVEAGIVFGFESDTPAVFRHTLDRLDDLEIDAIQASSRRCRASGAREAWRPSGSSWPSISPTSAASPDGGSVARIRRRRRTQPPPPRPCRQRAPRASSEGRRSAGTRDSRHQSRLQTRRHRGATAERD